MIRNTPLAQRIEHRPSKPRVVGSNPTGRTILAMSKRESSSNLIVSAVGNC
jgi:hypothetical protein